jgi:hypothetical protein
MGSRQDLRTGTPSQYGWLPRHPLSATPFRPAVGTLRHAPSNSSIRQMDSHLNEEGCKVRRVTRTASNFGRERREQPAPVAVWRLAVMVICLVAATIQGYVVQTHGHPAARPRLVLAAHLASGVSAAASSSAPVSEEHPVTQPGNAAACPICQAGLSGSAPLPAAVSTSVAPLAVASTSSFSRGPALLISAVSYSWQSRGPPLI